MISPRVRDMAVDSWGAVARVNFTGWGTCGTNTGGQVVVNLNDNAGADATVGYGGSTVTHVVNLGVQRGDFYGGLVAHEFGHVLGFHHEFERPDFDDNPGACQSGSNTTGDTLGTPPDYNSVLASTGYCQLLSTLSYYDRKGVQTAYGMRSGFVRDGSLNGDFLADLLFFEPGDNSIYAALSTGSGFGGASQWVASNMFGSVASGYYPGDFDGDQVMDLGYFEGSNNSFHVTISTTRAFAGPRSGMWAAPNTFGHTSGRHFVGDFDGDGRDDLGFFEPGNTAFYVNRSDGTKLVGASVWSQPGMFGTDRDNFFVGDFNNDGRTDLGYFQSGDNTFHVSLSTGTRFMPGTQWVTSNMFGNSTGRYYVGDYDGDGRDDLGLFQPGANTFHVALSTGATFDTYNAKIWVLSNWFGSNRDTFYPADYNGDKKIDLGYFERGDNSFHVALSSGSKFEVGSRWIAPNTFGHAAGRFMVTGTRRR